MRRIAAACLLACLVVVSCRPAGDQEGFGVREVEVQFTNDSVQLSGTLVLPVTATPSPAVVLVQGSGPETRRMYLRYAREFAAAGIAALAYDKRGAGKSSRNVSARAPYGVLAADAAAAVDLLRRHPGIDSTRIGLWGLSEGEWVASLAASLMRDPAFLILVSGSSLTPTEQVRLEMAKRLRRAGYPDSIVQLARSLHAGIAEFQRNGERRDSLNEELRRVAGEDWFRDAEDLDPELPPYARVLELSWFPAWRANMDFDALPLLRRLDAPVLVLLGGKDPKNDPALATARYREALSSSARSVDVKVFPNAEHALLEWWLPFRLPPPRYPDGYFDFQTRWARAQLTRR